MNRSANPVSEHILASSPAILYACRAYGDYGATFVSENITRLLGYAKSECLENPNFWRENIHPEDREQILAEMSDLYQRGHHVHEYRFRTKNGDYRWVLDEVRLIRDAAGQPVEIVGSWLDITDRKQMEEKLVENARLKSEFIATASHELRTPLTSATGYAELLLEHEGFSDEQRKQFHSIIYDKLLSLEKIIDELLDVNRIESGRMICLDYSSVEVSREIELVAQQMQREAPQHEICCCFDDRRTKLNVDRGKLVQVLENLIGNAIKFSPRGGRVEINGQSTAGNYQVEVSDEGIGLKEDQAEKIFDLFYRADGSNTAIKGLGIGLHIVKNIIAAHNGEIWVENNGGKGSRFCFTLPLALPTAEFTSGEELA